MKKIYFLLIALVAFSNGYAISDSTRIRAIFDESLVNGQAYEILRGLCKDIGPRLSGSENAEKAVAYTKKVMEDLGFDTVFLQEVMVPKWERGKPEKCILTGSKKFAQKPLKITALGNSISTGNKGLRAEIVEITDFAQLEEMGRERLEGKIVFYNIPMDPRYINTGRAYGKVGRIRWNGASEAAKYGAIASVNRALTLAQDDYPHTGSMGYKLNLPKIPGFSISTNASDYLSKVLKDEPKIQMYLESTCGMADSVLSHNVIGEIKGSEFPDEYIIVGGHLDSWDLAEGAHDDGAGCVQSIDALRHFIALGIKPKHSLRAVMFMNEENGLAGGKKYAEIVEKTGEKHVAALESDGGGFRPLGFGCSGTEEQMDKFQAWQPLFLPYDIFDFKRGGGGADIGPLRPMGIPTIGLSPDSQRYFDHHHTANDVFETVNKRELQLGSAALSSLIYLIDKYGF
ncbi:MAG: M20/M25/M40 family metallo-hydrolase [Cytophagales bacterium]